MHPSIQTLSEQMDALTWSMQIGSKTASSMSLAHSHSLSIEIILSPDKTGLSRVINPIYRYEISIYRNNSYNGGHPTHDLVVELLHQSDIVKIMSYEAKSFIYMLEQKMGKPMSMYDEHNILNPKE